MSRRYFGNIRKLASGRWQVRYQGADGRMRPEERTFATKADAQRYLSDVEHRLNAGTWLDPKARAELLSSYATDWIAHRDITTRVRELYEDLLRMHIKPQIGSMPIGALTPGEVRRWHRGRLDATGPQRTRQAYSLLRTILNTAVKDGLIATNPCQIKGAGSVKSPERPYMSKEKASALLDAMPEHMQTPALLTLLAHLRLGELLALRRGDVDLNGGTIHVQASLDRPRKSQPVRKSTKTGETRLVPLPPEALDAMRVHLAARGLPSAPLFHHPTGKPLGAHHVNAAMKSARKTTGLSQFRWHDLRHAGLTWYSQAGATIKETMERGGHRTPAAAMIYQHRAQERERKLAAELTLRPVQAAPEVPSEASGT